MARDEAGRPRVRLRAAMTPVDIDALFCCALRSRAVRDEARCRIRPEHFSKPGERGYAVLWDVLCRLADDFPRDDSVPVMDLVLAVREAADDPRSGVYAEERAHLLREPSDAAPGGGLIWYVYNKVVPGVDFRPDTGYQLIKRFLTERAVHADMRQVALVGGDAQVITNWGELAAAGRALAEQVDAISDDPFESVKHDDVQIAPVVSWSTQVAPVDYALAGGPAAGEIIGLLGPTGRGKSTLVNQVAVGSAAWHRAAAAARGERPRLALIVSYEDPFERIEQRVLSCAARVSREKLVRAATSATPLEEALSRTGRLGDEDLALAALEGEDPGEFPGEFERYMAARDALHENLRIVSMTKSGRGFGGVAELVGLIRRGVDRRGQEVGLVVVDSIDLMAMGWAIGQNAKDVARAKGDAISSLVFELRKRVGEEFGCAVFAVNQVAGANLGWAAGRTYSHSDAASNKSWGAQLDAHCALSNPNGHGVAVLHWSKVRRTPHTGHSSLVRLDGDRARWLPADADWTIAQGTIVKKDVGDMYCAPTTLRLPARTSAETLDDDDLMTYS